MSVEANTSAFPSTRNRAGAPSNERSRRSDYPAGPVSDDLKLHLGCFDQRVQGWVNTDITPHIWIARLPFASRILYAAGRITSDRWEQHRRGVFRHVKYLDVSKRFPYGDDSISAVFTCHMLEHLYPWVARHCVEECRRVLRPGGVLRIVVPDLDKLIARYDERSPNSFLEGMFEYGHGLAKNSHCWHYNFCNLRELLLSVRFSRIERRNYRQGECPDLKILDNRPDESLFVEAFK